MKKKLALLTGTILTISATAVFGEPQIGQSAIQTLAFPWGGRSLGMAETFTGIADNSEALFYNPAGLGQTPLAKGWIHSFNKESEEFNFTHVAAKPNRELADKELIWALRDNGILYEFNGVTWINYSLHLLEDGETLREVAERFLEVKEYAHIDNTVIELMKFNGIGNNAKNEISALLSTEIQSNAVVDSLAEILTYLPVNEQNETDILGYIFESIPDEKSNDIAVTIVDILNKPNEFSDLLEVKVPFSIGPTVGITDLAVDYSGRLWVGTDNGLWRFDGTWKQFTQQDGLQSDSITVVKSIDNTTLIVGTSKGAVRFTDGIFSKIAENHIDVAITDVAQRDETTVFLGSSEGLIKVTDDTLVNTITSESGILSDYVTALMVDSRGRIWVGSEGGISIFNDSKWQQYQFKGSVVNTFAEVSPSLYWIATDKGAVQMKEHDNGAPEWKVYHSKNGLPSSNVHDIFQFGNDTWLAHGAGISQLKSGEVHAQAFIEQLLPSLGIDDIWHAAFAGVIPVAEWGSLGLQVNFLNFGEVPQWNADGSQKEGISSSFEFVGGLSYGLPIKPDFSVGMSLKYAYSKLTSDAQAHSISMDAALLKNNLIVPNLSLGFSMLNMGPAIYYDKEQDEDPIPFTMRYGMGYKPIKTPAVELLVAFDLEREFVYKEDGEPMPFFQAMWYDVLGGDDESAKDELAKIIFHSGVEFTYAQLIRGRLGFMHDKAGSRDEMTFGVGIKTNIILADFGMIFALGENDIRNNQVRFSVTYAR